MIAVFAVAARLDFNGRLFEPLVSGSARKTGPLLFAGRRVSQFSRGRLLGTRNQRRAGKRAQNRRAHRARTGQNPRKRCARIGTQARQTDGAHQFVVERRKSRLVHEPSGAQRIHVGRIRNRSMKRSPVSSACLLTTCAMWRVKHFAPTRFNSRRWAQFQRR